jgi:hypothetical protein
VTDEQPAALILVRFRKGIVGEASRVCHIVPVPTGDTMPETLTAYCGTRIGPAEAEWLRQIGGMPCIPCLAFAPLACPATPPVIMP